MAAKKRKSSKSKSIVSQPKFSKRSFSIFGLAFVLIGGLLLFRAFAATASVNWYGALTASNPTKNWTLTTGAGTMGVTFSNNTADVTLTVRNKAAKIVGSIASKGKKDVKLSIPIVADTYSIDLTTKAKFTGKKGYSIQISYPTKDIALPTAIISQPLDKETATGIVDYTVTSKAGTAIDRVEFYVDNSLLSLDTTSPFTVKWDTTKYTDAIHLLSVKAFDATGNVADASGSIQVNNKGGTVSGQGVGETADLDKTLLTPPKGKILLGAEMPGGGYATAKSLRGKELQISHSYARSGTDVKNLLAASPKGTIPLVNFKPAGAMGAAEYKKILAGTRDGAIKDAAAAAKAYKKRFFFSPMHEPEDDDKDAPYAGDGDYAKAFTYIVNMMKANGATNIVVTWNMMGYGKWMGRYDKLYPGDGVVDWIASDPYSTNAKDTLNSYHSVKDFYNWAAKHNKPMMWAEWGLHKNVASNAANFFSKSGLDAVQAQMPLIKGMVYWSETDYLLQNYSTPWKTFSNLPAFDWTVPADMGV